MQTPAAVSAAFKTIAARSARTEPYFFYIPPVNRKPAADFRPKPGVINFAETVFIEQRASENEFTAGPALFTLSGSSACSLSGPAPGQGCQAEPAKLAVEQDDVAFGLFNDVADIHLRQVLSKTCTCLCSL